MGRADRHHLVSRVDGLDGEELPVQACKPRSTSEPSAWTKRSSNSANDEPVRSPLSSSSRTLVISEAVSRPSLAELHIHQYCCRGCGRAWGVLTSLECNLHSGRSGTPTTIIFFPSHPFDESCSVECRTVSSNVSIPSTSGTFGRQANPVAMTICFVFIVLRPDPARSRSTVHSCVFASCLQSGMLRPGRIGWPVGREGEVGHVV